MYSTRTEAIIREIVEPIEATGAVKGTEYNVEAIADEVLGAYASGYTICVDPEEFWAIVERHAV